MAKQIEFAFEDVNYTLEFTRDSVKKTERSGFVISQAGDMPVTMLPLMFHGAFLAHHPKMKQEDAERILDSITNKQELFERLSEMYCDTVNAMAEDPQKSEKNVTWGANW